MKTAMKIDRASLTKHLRALKDIALSLAVDVEETECEDCRALLAFGAYSARMQHKFLKAALDAGRDPVDSNEYLVLWTMSLHATRGYAVLSPERYDELGDAEDQIARMENGTMTVTPNDAAAASNAGVTCARCDRGYGAVPV